METYKLQLEETMNAAIAYAHACARCGAPIDRLSIIQFCINSLPSVLATDAMDIALVVRGMFINAK